MSEKYKKDLLFKVKDLNRTKNDKYIPLTVDSGVHAEARPIEPARVVDKKENKFKAGDRIFTGKKTKTGRNIYSDPDIFN